MKAVPLPAALFTLNRERLVKKLLPRSLAVLNANDIMPSNADGTLGDSVMLVDLSGETAPGITDGMKVDVKGNIWTTGPGGVWVISPVGKPLGVIPLPEGGTNVVFGDADKKTLYIAARTSIYKIRTNVAGLP